MKVCPSIVTVTSSPTGISFGYGVFEESFMNCSLRFSGWVRFNNCRIVFEIEGLSFCFFSYLRKATTTSLRFNPAIGTVRQITANELNLRAGPGTKYQIVRIFNKGEKIVTFEDKKEVDGYVWIRATTPDGQSQGWIVRKYLSQQSQHSSINRQDLSQGEPFHIARWESTVPAETILCSRTGALSSPSFPSGSAFGS